MVKNIINKRRPINRKYGGDPLRYIKCKKELKSVESLTPEDRKKYEKMTPEEKEKIKTLIQ